MFYLVVASDRHSDDEYILCRTLESALTQARVRVDDAAIHYHVQPGELNTAIPGGWLFYAALEDAFSVHIESIKVAP